MPDKMRMQGEGPARRRKPGKPATAVPATRKRRHAPAHRQVRLPAPGCVSLAGRRGAAGAEAPLPGAGQGRMPSGRQNAVWGGILETGHSDTLL
jgi:hypothetical protein